MHSAFVSRSAASCQLRPQDRAQHWQQGQSKHNGLDLNTASLRLLQINPDRASPADDIGGVDVLDIRAADARFQLITQPRPHVREDGVAALVCAQALADQQLLRCQAHWLQRI